MLYKYDNSICDDLRDSFNQDILDGPVVKVIEPENIVSLAAQIQEDKISFPVVALSRDDPEIDRARMNFTRLHQGVSTVFDAEKNEYYNEKVIPILTVERPVTQMLEVEINRASKNLSSTSGFKHMGRYRRIAPINAPRRKPNIIILVVDKDFFFIINISYFLQIIAHYNS